MKTRPFGKTGFQCSEIGFGAWAIGGTGYGPTDDRVSLQTVQRALDLGVTFMSDRYRLPLAQVALKFVLSREEISVVIPGAKTPKQVEENVRAVEDGYLNSFYLN